MVFEKRVIHCNNPRCRRYICTMEIIIDMRRILVPSEFSGKTIEFAEVKNIKCTRCKQKSNFVIAQDVGTAKPLEIDPSKGEG